jgi:hypothetical protein
MASRKDTLFNTLALVFAIFAFVGLITFVVLNLETYRVRSEIFALNGEGNDSVKERLLKQIALVSAEYSKGQQNLKTALGFKEKYAETYGQINGLYPMFPEYMENNAPKPYMRKDKEGAEVQDSGLIKNIDRVRNNRQDESEEADKFFRISKEEIIKQPAIMAEQNKNILRKIEDGGKLEKHIFTIKLEADDEIKKMRDDFSRMDNELNIKVDEHLRKMSKKGLILEEMKTRLDILKRKNFNIVEYEEFLKLSRQELELEAEKEHLKNVKNLDQEQLAEAVFQSRSIDGKVTVVSDDRKTIIIDVGSVNGLKAGQSFDVFELKNGTTKIVHGKIEVKQVNKFSSVCSPLITDKKVPLIVPNYFVGDFDFTSFQKSEYVLVGEYKSRYTVEELVFMLKQKDGLVAKSIGYSTNYLVLGEKPMGDYPADEIAEQMKDESLYYKKTISEIVVLYGFSEKITEYAVLFESAKEMGVKILDEVKLLENLSEK